jgi:tRNA threonylcarbamoyladenosine biosynthesis protein TsaB
VRILALDTATENCSAALLIDGRLAVRERLAERGHAAAILAMIDEVLAEGSATLAGVDAIAFGRGPGSFTGVRLAASVTQGLAYGAGVPVVPVSDLRALACRAFEAQAGAQQVLKSRFRPTGSRVQGSSGRGPDSRRIHSSRT